MSAVKTQALRLALKLVMVVIAAGVVFTFVISLQQMKGNDMFPSIKDGDLMLAYKLERTWKVGDVVLYDVQGTEHVGRIVAIPGDTVDIRADTGQIEVNGSILNDDMVFATAPGNTLTYPLTVAEHTYFILGDYRTKAQDSRVFGCIDANQLSAKVISIVRRRGI